MKTTFLFLLSLVLILNGCNSRLQELSVNEINLNSTTGILYEPLNNKDVPTFVILDDNENRAHNWTKTATRISQSGYRVLVTSADSLVWADILSKTVVNNSNFKIGILGVGQAAEHALKITANDTTIGAVITLDAANFLQYDKSTFAQITPRPHLVLEATLNPQSPEQKKQLFFESSQEPKKLVWLATDLTGSNIVNSDLEPIVRRTVLMLIDRYLKGKK